MSARLASLWPALAAVAGEAGQEYLAWAERLAARPVGRQGEPSWLRRVASKFQYDAVRTAVVRNAATAEAGRRIALAAMAA